MGTRSLHRDLLGSPIPLLRNVHLQTGGLTEQVYPSHDFKVTRVHTSVCPARMTQDVLRGYDPLVYLDERIVMRCVPLAVDTDDSISGNVGIACPYPTTRSDHYFLKETIIVCFAHEMSILLCATESIFLCATQKDFRAKNDEYGLTKLVVYLRVCLYKPSLCTLNKSNFLTFMMIQRTQSNVFYATQQVPGGGVMGRGYTREEAIGKALASLTHRTGQDQDGFPRPLTARVNRQ